MAPPSFKCGRLQICPFTMENTWCFQMVFFPFQSRGEKPDMVLVTVHWATGFLITQLFLVAVSEWRGSLQQVLVVTSLFKCRREYCAAINYYNLGIQQPVPHHMAGFLQGSPERAASWEQAVLQLMCCTDARTARSPEPQQQLWPWASEWINSIL